VKSLIFSVTWCRDAACWSHYALNRALLPSNETAVDIDRFIIYVANHIRVRIFFIYVHIESERLTVAARWLLMTSFVPLCNYTSKTDAVERGKQARSLLELYWLLPCLISSWNTRELPTCGVECIQGVRWLYVNTPITYYWGHSLSEMSNEHGLRRYGYLKWLGIICLFI
jgi:hypothetical protein